MTFGLSENYLLLIGLANRFLNTGVDMIGKETLIKYNTFRKAASKDALGSNFNGIKFIHTSSADISKVITFINTSLRAINFISDMGILSNTKDLAEDVANKLLDKAFDYMTTFKNGDANGKNLMGIGQINSTDAYNLATAILTDLYKVTSSVFVHHAKRINIDGPLLLAFQKDLPGARALILSHHLTNPIPFYKMARAKESIEKDLGDIKWTQLIKKLEEYPQVQKLLVML